MAKTKIDLIAGTRPNFVKIAALYSALSRNQQLSEKFKVRLIHTGQHYDFNMSESFFSQLGIPTPDHNFGIGAGTHAEQTGAIMKAYEALLSNQTTDLCVVVGDVNSTMACTSAAKKLNVLVAHIEGGIRSGDRSMPEEINRIVTDSICDYFFTTTELASNNLLDSGIKSENIFFVGNTMIDTLFKNLPNFKAPQFFKEKKLSQKKYLVLTLHRPSNVDDLEKFSETIESICIAAEEMLIVFPAHPRTQKLFENNVGLPGNLILVEPLPYLEFNWIVQHAAGVITDSGGITEETTVMSVPCITLRATTERPETVTIGTNVLVGDDTSQMVDLVTQISNGVWKDSSIPEMWDGCSGERILSLISELGLS